MFGDTNHSPASVLASEQLRPDGEPARGAMLAFSWAGWLGEQTAPPSLAQNKCPRSRRRGNGLLSHPGGQNAESGWLHEGRRL